MLAKQEGERPRVTAETLLSSKEDIFRAWKHLPSEHQATVTLVMINEVLQGEWGAWLFNAFSLQYAERKEENAYLNTAPSMETEASTLTFPVITISRSHLKRVFSEEEVAQFTDQEIAQIAEEMRIDFTVDPGFWYAVEMTGRRILTERDEPPEDVGHQLPDSEQQNQYDEAAYTDWMQTVDEVVWQMAACSVYDLPDYEFRMLFDDDVIPAYAAEQALIAAGFSKLEGNFGRLRP